MAVMQAAAIIKLVFIAHLLVDAMQGQRERRGL
jgi:hypothetical protein